MMVGGEVHALGIARDTSDRKAADQALREAVDSLAEAQRIAHVGNWSGDPLTGQVEFSDEALRIYGLEPGKPGPTLIQHRRLMTADSLQRLVAASLACLQTGAAFKIELQLTRPGAVTRWAEASGERYVTAAGQPRLRGALQDISERKAAEEALRDEQTLFQRLVEKITSGICIVSEDGRLSYINPRGLEMLGVADAGELADAPVWSFIGEAHRQPVARAMKALFDNRRSFVEMEVTVLPADGKEVAALAQCTIATFRGERGVLAVVTDITERKRSQDRIARLNKDMTATLVTLRRHEQDLTMTAKFSDLLQSCRTTVEAYPIIAAAAKALFPDASGALARVDPDGGRMIRVATWGERSSMAAASGADDCWALRGGHRHESQGPQDAPQCAHFTATPTGPYLCLPLTVRGETGGLLTLETATGTVIDDELRQRLTSFGDVIKLSLANLSLLETLAGQAMSDQLTGLFNRRHLADSLPRQIRRARRSHAPLTVAMIDIDHFKAFNDAYGHDAGDFVLSELAALLTQSLRSGDTACRYGGEEFLLVMPDCEGEAAHARLTGITAALKAKTFTFDGAALPGVTLSIGLAPLCESLTTADQLIRAADEALYRAKAKGRDSVEIWTAP